MKHYDFDKVKKIIEESKNCLSEASLGMHEDWFWTAETVWTISEGYTKELPCGIGGIVASNWATPTLQLVYTDGTEKMLPCYKGEPTDPVEHVTTVASMQAMLLGPLSSDAQDNITPLSE